MLEDYALLQPANAPLRVADSFYMQASRAHVQCPRRTRDRHIRLGSPDARAARRRDVAPMAMTILAM
jgi:hypothetical protein